MTKLDEWIRSFPENCKKLKERAERGCEESQEFLDKMEKMKSIGKFDESAWAELAHIRVTIFAMTEFAESINALDEACNSGDYDAAESALLKVLSTNSKDLIAFSDYVEETTGKPSVVRGMIPVISDSNSDRFMENESMSTVRSAAADADLKESHIPADIATLREDAMIVADTFGRAKHLVEAMDSGCEKDILSAAEEFVNADDGEAIDYLSKILDKDDLSDEEMEVIREMYESADLEHLDLDRLNVQLEDRKEKKPVPKPDKKKEKSNGDIQICTYADWRSSWHR